MISISQWGMLEVPIVPVFNENVDRWVRVGSQSVRSVSHDRRQYDAYAQAYVAPDWDCA